VTKGIDDASCASLSPESLPGLAGVRIRPGVRVRDVDGRLWLWWSAGDVEVLKSVLPLPGVELFARSEGLWYRTGRRLPSTQVPDESAARPLSSVLTPAPVTPQDAALTVECIPLGVARDAHPRPATMLRSKIDHFARWAETATTRQLEALEAAYGGEDVLLRGERLPPLAGAERWWGADVLIPLGFRPEPDLAGEVLRQVMGLAPGEVALLTDLGAEVVPAGAFGPVTRAGVRLAVRGRG
jgi:hypothetical protein